MNLEPRVAMKAMNELARQADELDGKRRILALAIRDIENIARDPLNPDGYDAILRIVTAGGVREAMSE